MSRWTIVWPRLVYWGSLVLVTLGLLLAAVGGGDTIFEDRDTRMTGGIVGLVAIVGVVLGKIWLDAVSRSRYVITCPSCGTQNRFQASFCESCGAPLRLRPPATAATPSSDSPEQVAPERLDL